MCFCPFPPSGPVLWGTLFAATAAGRWAIHWHWVFILIAASLMVFANTAKSGQGPSTRALHELFWSPKFYKDGVHPIAIHILKTQESTSGEGVRPKTIKESVFWDLFLALFSLSHA